MARPPNPEAPRRLLEAARRAFSQVGVDAARVQDITAEAGFSKAAFYLYFDSKEAVYARLVADLFQRMSDLTNRRQCAFESLVAAEGTLDVGDYVKRTPRLRAYENLDHQYTVEALRALWDERDVVRMVLDQTTGPRRLMVDQLMDALMSTLSSRLAMAVAAGVVRKDLDPHLASEMMVGIYLQLGRHMMRLEQAPDFESWARAVDSFIAQGLGPAPSTSSGDVHDP